jgi:aminoglycoside phosphotransferase (APT) family kinase protein
MEQAEYYMSIAVDIQQKIHSIDADSIEPMSEKLSRQIQSADILGDERKSILLQRLNTMTSEKKLCHGDYHVFNLIMANDNVTIIDWVDSSIGDIRADVYRSYLLYSQISMELADLYLRLYCEKSGLSKDEVFLWAPIIAGARLSENVSTEKTERLLEIINKHCPL